MIGIDIGTLHDHPTGLCSANPGIYVLADGGLAAGVVRNSECRLGAWGGYTRSSGILSVTVGVVAGYRFKPLLPMLIPSVKIDRFRLSYLPRSPGAQSGGLHLSVEFNGSAHRGGFSFWET